MTAMMASAQAKIVSDENRSERASDRSTCASSATTETT